MKVSASDLLTVAAGLAAGLAVLYAVRKLSAAAESLGAAPSRALEAISEAAGEAIDYVASLPAAVADKAVSVYDAAIKPSANTHGWQFFSSGVAIDPKGRYWRGTKIIYDPADYQ